MMFPSSSSALILPLLIASMTASVFANSALVEEGAVLKKLEGEYSFTEGPATDSAGNVYFTDQPNDRIVKWNANDRSVSDWLNPAGRSNGLYFDAKGNLLACADEQNQLWSIAPNKAISVLIENVGGKLLNGPNDLWIDPEGGIYFTDPHYKRPYWKRDPEPQQAGQFVYYLKPGDAAPPKAVVTGLKQPNGLIGTPDGKTLYVADIGANQTFCYDIAGEGILQNKRLFCELGSDGMTLDAERNVYLTGKGVTVFDEHGKQIAVIEVPEPWTANVTFGGADRKLLFITASKGIYSLQMKVAGAH